MAILKTLRNLEVSFIIDGEKVGRKSDKKNFKEEVEKIAADILADEKLTFLACISTVIASKITNTSIKYIMPSILYNFNYAMASITKLGDAKELIKQLSDEIIGFAGVGLVVMVSGRTIIDIIQILWKNQGGSLNYEQTFSVLLKNLSLLAIGLGISSIAWWLLELFQGI